MHILIASTYFLLIVGAVVVEHHYLGHLPELVRRGIGGCTVLAPAFVLALVGVIDLWTWLIISAGFVAAGGTLAALVMMENNGRKGNGGADDAEDLRRKIEKITGFFVN